MKKANYIYKYLLLTVFMFTSMGIYAVSKTVYLSSAGTLSNYISSSQKYTITDLTISGYINDDDISLIREMAGCDYYGKYVSSGSLETLNLSSASVRVGQYYFLSAKHIFYTPDSYIYKNDESDYLGGVMSDNTIPNYFMMGCSKLKSIVLPNSVTTIGSNAFAGCTSLEEITIGSNVTTIGSQAFWMSALKYLIVPSSVTSCGSNIFRGCTKFAALVWNPSFKVTDDMIGSDVMQNPNLLLYTTSSSYDGTTVKNYIWNGTASTITLTDKSGDYSNFYCPQRFYANSISYTHTYSMDTQPGVCKGWDTITLPFDVGEIYNSSKGYYLTPFYNWYSSSSYKPFWLYKLTSSGFTSTGSILANVPYLISMPNSTSYSSSYNVSGNVTFSSTYVYVPVTTRSTYYYNSKYFVPCMESKPYSSSIYTINATNNIVTNGGIGDRFVSYDRYTHPFEAYMTTSGANTARSWFGIFDDMATGIEEVTADNMFEKGNVKIFNADGQLMMIVEANRLDEAMKTLKKGVYIVNGKRILNK